MIDVRTGLVAVVLSLFFGIEGGIAQGAQVVCIGSSGALTVREKKCVSGETKATMANLPQRGEKGATGASGGAGRGTRRIERISDDFLHFNELSESRMYAFCNDDEVVLGGGCGCFNDQASHSRIVSSSPMPIVQSNPGRAGWRCSMIPGAGYSVDAGEFRAYAICAQVN